jgi:hypothetical protein
MDRVLRLATREVEVRNVLLHVFSMLLPVSALFSRAVLWRVMREEIFGVPAHGETSQSRRRIEQRKASWKTRTGETS